MDTIVKVMDLDLLRRLDRMSLYSADLLRSVFFILLVAGSFIKNKYSSNTAIILVGLFMVSDLFLSIKTMFRHKIL
jgi:hypothetical protein